MTGPKEARHDRGHSNGDGTLCGLSEPLLSVTNLAVKLRSDGGQETRVLDGVSLSVRSGKTTALVGESGSGKTITSLAILGLLNTRTARISDDSRIVYRGQNLLRLTEGEMGQLRGSALSMIFQDPAASLNPVLRVGSQIVQTLTRHLGMNKRRARSRAVELLAEVGIPDPEQRVSYYPHQLSGGQQQRVMIAMAIACEPELLIADEPTSALDVTVQRQIILLLKHIQSTRGLALLFITHDLDLAAELADEITVLHRGVTIESGETASVLLSPTQEITRRLLFSRPRFRWDLPDVNRTIVPGGPLRRESPMGAASDADVILEVQRLGKDFDVPSGFFGRRTVTAVEDVSFNLKRGRTTGLIGESGAGKSTVAKMLLRLITASRGRILFDGVDLCQVRASDMRRLRRRLQIVFQNPYASLHPRRTVERILVDPMELHGIGVNDSVRRRLALKLVEKVRLDPALLTRLPVELSGGQRQRVAIARSLALEPEILVCDECVSALDVSSQAQILDLLKVIQRELGTTFLFISHDLVSVRQMSDEVLVMRDGRVVECGPTEQVCSAPLSSYTRQLIDAIPRGLDRLATSVRLCEGP